MTWVGLALQHQLDLVYPLLRRSLYVAPEGLTSCGGCAPSIPLVRAGKIVTLSVELDDSRGAWEWTSRFPWTKGSTAKRGKVSETRFRAAAVEEGQHGKRSQFPRRLWS